jgi:purine/pyrimidine-nucleoside phosphorylase
MPTAEFSNVTVATKANIYFEGKVVSHTLRFADGSKKTIGLVYPGTYHFSTDVPERMEIVSGACKVKLAGKSDFTSYAAGASFDVPAKSAFDIVVEAGIAEYICSYL